MKVGSISGVGPKNVNLLAKMGIETVEDLLNYYPYRYNYISIGSLSDEQEIKTIKCTIMEIPIVSYIKRNFNRMAFRAIANNEVINVIIFNRAFMKNNLTLNKEIVLIGKYNSLKKTFTASDIKFNVTDNTIEPVYHLTLGLKNSYLNKIITNALETDFEVYDTIPEYLNEEYKFIDKKTAIKWIHAPRNVSEVKQAKLKLIYEELFDFMFKINYLKKFNKKVLGIKRNISNINDFINTLPFELTEDQKTTFNDILNDLNSEYRMNRLVLGDVGSGKTVVSVLAMYVNFLSGYQSALMAPTEILAKQHYHNCINLFKDTNVVVELLTGKMTKKEKEIIYKKLENNEIDIIIGTHSLFNENIIYNNLGLVVTDEQHRFGVNARNNLQNKGIYPDVLYLSATPIPRTYALSIYGDLDLSMIKTKPKGRKEIITTIKKQSEIKDVLYKMLEEIKNEHQVYVVSPLIETNDELDLKSVIELKEKFSLAFPGTRIEVMHGKLTNDEKNKIMQAFENNEVKILISTTVIEVGIDVKNATTMVIYNAERFGLATLHQLRGRIGRGDLESHCFLVSDYDTERLKVLEESNDGFYISEKDFELRGGGDIFGVRQSGDILFHLADLKRDYKILLKAKEDSGVFVEKELYKDNSYYESIIEKINFIN